MLGWLAQLLFAGMRLAGQEIEIKSGLGLIQLVDPHEGGQSGVFSAFLELMAGTDFLRYERPSFADSSAVFELQRFSAGRRKIYRPRLPPGLVNSAGEIFAIALAHQRSGAHRFALDRHCLGFISRAIPQMNVFMVAQPVQFGFAMLLLMLSSAGSGVVFRAPTAADGGCARRSGLRRRRIKTRPQEPDLWLKRAVIQWRMTSIRRFRKNQEATPKRREEAAWQRPVRPVAAI